MFRFLKGFFHLLIAIFSLLWFRYPGRKLTIIGITGTDGKTTTTTLVYEILKAAGYKTSMITSVHAVIAGKSYDTGFHVTTPNAFWVQKYLREAVDHGDTHFILEVTSHGIDQHRVFGIPFAVGVITNVTHEHLDWHKTYQNYLQTKLKLFLWSKICVVNRDDALVYAAALSYMRNKKLVSFGIRRDALITPNNYLFTTHLPGEFNKYNCLAAIAVCYGLGIPKRVVTSTVGSFRGVIGRMEIIKTKPFKVIVDFAHTPNALEQVLKTVRTLTRKRLIHVFGSAGLRDKTKRPLMGKASAQYADCIILTEEDYRTENVTKIIDEIASGIPIGREVYKVPNRGEAISLALKLAKGGDLVIITGKGHEKSLCRGKVEYPWSDQEEVKKNLKTLR